MYAEISILTGLLLLILFPGYPLTLALYAKKRIDLSERLLLSIVSSISLNILSMYALSYFLKVPLNAFTLSESMASMTIIFIAIYFYRLKELPYLYVEDTDSESILRTLSIALLLFVAFLLVYSIHTDYPYPYILDEWHHLSEGIKFADVGGIDFSNPYYQTPNTETGLLDMGSNLFLAEVILFTGQNPVLLYAYLPAVFASLGALAVYSSTKSITKSYGTALLAMLFYAGLKSNINVQGLWFFLPYTLSFPLMYAALYLSIEGLEKNRNERTILSILTLSALSLIYPWTFLITVIVIAAYALMGLKAFRERIKRLAGLFVVPAISFASLYVSQQKGLDYLIKNFVTRGLEIPVREVARPEYVAGLYGPAALVLAAAGMYYALKGKKEERIYAPFAGFIVLDLLFFQASNSTFLAPYERLVYYMMLSLVPLSAMGLYGILKKTGDKINNRAAVLVITIIAVSLVTYTLFQPYYESRDNLYRIINDDSYNALKWLEANRGRHNVILSRPEISSAVYPVTRNYVVSILGTDSTSRLEDNRNFFRSNCDQKKAIIQKYGVDLLLLGKDDRIRCDYATNIYRYNSFYIYEVI